MEQLPAACYLLPGDHCKVQSFGILTPAVLGWGGELRTLHDHVLRLLVQSRDVTADLFFNCMKDARTHASNGRLCLLQVV